MLRRTLSARKLAIVWSATLRPMRRMLGIVASGFAPLLLTSSASGLTVEVQTTPTVDSSVQLHFSAPALPDGGYYYGVVVLRPYRHFTRTIPPACSTSSEMQRTDYGYPQTEGRLALALAPAKSDTGRWCRGGSYEGAVYAVPHPPPCQGEHPCFAGEPSELPPRPCPCGVVALRTWSYPSPLPPPLARGATIVDRFSVSFPTRTLRTIHLSATVYDVTETLRGVVSSHEALRHAGRPAGQDFSTCEPWATETARCTGKYALAGGTITFAGTIASRSRSNTLTITGGTGRYQNAEGTVLTEYNRSRAHAQETIGFEGLLGR